MPRALPPSLRVGPPLRVGPVPCTDAATAAGPASLLAVGEPGPALPSRRVLRSSASVRGDSPRRAAPSPALAGREPTADIYHINVPHTNADICSSQYEPMHSYWPMCSYRRSALGYHCRCAVGAALLTAQHARASRPARSDPCPSPGLATGAAPAGVFRHLLRVLSPRPRRRRSLRPQRTSWALACGVRPRVRCPCHPANQLITNRGCTSETES